MAGTRSPRATSFVFAAAMTVIVVTSSATATIAGRVDSGWRQFQFGPSHTGYNPSETTLGPDTVGQLTRLWKTPIPGTYELSAPTVANERVVVESGRMYSLDATTGAIDWSFPAATSLGQPAIVRGRIYERNDDGTVFAVDAWSGDVRWSADTGGWGGSSVTVTHGVVYMMGQADHLYAVDATTGSVLWSTPTVFAYESPSVAAGRVYIHGDNDNVVAFDAATGTQLWKRRHLTGGQSSIAISRKRLYLGGTNGLFALYRGGATAWHVAGDNSCFNVTPSIAEGVVYTAGCGGALQAYDGATGELLWSSPVPYIHSVSIANGVVWTQDIVGSINYEGQLLGFDAATGELLVSRALDHIHVSSVVVSEGNVYVSAGHDVYAYGLPS